MDMEGRGGVAACIGSKGHGDGIKARSRGWPMAFSPKVEPQVLWRLWLSRRFHHTEGIEGSGRMRGGGLRLSLVEVGGWRRGIDGPVAQAVGKSPAAVHPHTFALCSTMGVLGDAQVELGHVIAQVRHARVALTVQEAGTHLGQILTAGCQVVFILIMRESQSNNVMKINTVGIITAKELICWLI